MKGRLTTLLAIALACGCQKNPTRLAFEKAASQLQKATIEARAAGIDASILPNGINAEAPNLRSTVANLVRDLYQKVEDRNDFQINVGKYVKSSDPRNLSRVALTFSKIRTDLDAISKASHLPSPPPTRGLPGFDKDTASYRDGVKLLCMRAILSTRMGQTESSVADLRAALLLCEKWVQPYDTLSQVLGGSFQANVTQAVEWCITFAAPGSLPRVAGLLEQIKNPVKVQEAMIGEAIRTLDLSHVFEVQEPDSYATAEVARFRNAGVPQTLMAKGFRTRNLQFWTQSLESARASKSFAEQIRTLDALYASTQQKSDPASRLLGIVSIGPSRIVNIAALNSARIAVVKALVPAVQHYRRTGTWPAELVGNPSDPFTDKPLHFKFSGGTAVIYSVGQDGQDNGGSPQADVTAKFPAE